MPDVIALAKESIDAYNRGDWGRIRQLFASDGVYQEIATGRTARGVDEFNALNQGWKSALPDSKGTVTSALASGDTAVIEVTWEGTHTGPLQTPTGETIQPTGRSVKVPGVQIIKTSGDQIKETRHYFDAMSLMVQLGVIPAGSRT